MYKVLILVVAVLVGCGDGNAPTQSFTDTPVSLRSSLGDHTILRFESGRVFNSLNTPPDTVQIGVLQTFYYRSDVWDDHMDRGNVIDSVRSR